ncbi:MAG TPA: hypothetical protein VMV15_15050 [Candidatus Binataceae bacterium]|nr:hypothetical protein [Candidatus Binataceae bacterium]
MAIVVEDGFARMLVPPEGSHGMKEYRVTFDEICSDHNVRQDVFI